MELSATRPLKGPGLLGARKADCWVNSPKTEGQSQRRGFPPEVTGTIGAPCMESHEETSGRLATARLIQRETPHMGVRATHFTFRVELSAPT